MLEQCRSDDNEVIGRATQETKSTMTRKSSVERLRRQSRAIVGRRRKACRGKLMAYLSARRTLFKCHVGKPKSRVNEQVKQRVVEYSKSPVAVNVLTTIRLV